VTLPLALPTGARGRALAAAITLLAAALLWLALVAPMLGWYAERQARLGQQRVLAQRMEAMLATLPALRRIAQDAAATATPAGAVLEGATDQVAAATLQQKLDELARASDVRIGSAEVLPAEAAGAWRAISVRVEVRAPWPALVALLAAIAGSPTPMVVDAVQLQGPPRAEHEPDLIEAHFTVTAYRDDKAAPS
jgi:general secretion pathway protein M